MTPVQHRALAYVRDYQDQHGCSPTFAEIAQGCGWQSRSSAYRAIRLLVDQGHLLSEGGRTRGLRLPMPSLAAVPTSVLAAELSRRQRETAHG